MKKLIIALMAVLSFATAKAQVLDDFESNNFGWTESVGSNYEAIIKEGHLHLKGKSKPGISACYAPFDLSRPFELRCEAFVKSLTGSKNFGILIDYEDDDNYILFSITNENINVKYIKEGKEAGHRTADLKIKSKKKTGMDFRLEYTLQKIVLYVNDVRAIEYQRRLEPGQFMLGTTGIGFYVDEDTEVDFDNLEIRQ